MPGSRRFAACLAATALVLSVLPVAAQEDAAPVEPMSEMIVEVTGVDYAFVDLPTTVPAGTELTFRNDGTEFHEMIVVRILDEVTPLAELAAMPQEETEAISQFVGYLSSFPGGVAEGSVVLAEPGRYVVTCVIRQGSDPAAFEAIGFDPMQLTDDTDPSTLPPEVQELLATIEANPQHQDLGMLQEFTVTSAEGEAEATA